MPHELLKMIQALETYRTKPQVEAKMPDKFTVGEFVEMMDQMFGNDEPKEKSSPASATPKYIQHQGSYKVVSLDGTITAMDIASTDLVQVTKDTISLVWPHTSIEFTTIPGEEHSTISKEEFRKLADFVTQ